MSDPDTAKGANDGGAWWLLYAAWMIALAATLGALFVGEVMGQTPCNLCWFQRAFMFPLAVVLSLAVVRSDRVGAIYALPLAAIGGAVAGFHTLLYAGVIPATITPCTAEGPSCSGADMSVLGLPLPYLSMVAFGLVATLLLLAQRRVTP